MTDVMQAGDVVMVEPVAGAAAAGGAGKARRPAGAAGGRCAADAAADPAGAGRAGVAGSDDRPRAGDGRRLELRAEPVQPRHPGAAPARLQLQADGLSDRAGDRASRPASDSSMRRSWCDHGRQGTLAAEQLRAGRSAARRRCAIALEKSLNLVTLRRGADRSAWRRSRRHAIAFHMVDSMPRVLPAALGAVETTVMREAGAYAVARRRRARR